MIEVKNNRSSCPVSTALEIVGDQWSLVIIRDLFLERTTFSEFRNSPEKIATNILTDRLNKLLSYDLIGYMHNPKNKKIKIEDKVIADSCEALIGAIYLEKGFSFVEKTIIYLWHEHIKKSVITEIDAKTKLQEYSLKIFKKLPTYKLISNTGPRHKPLFKVGVKLENSKMFISESNSKKNAEQNAAILCLRGID